MDQNFGKSNVDPANQSAAPMAQCEISGEWVPVDELVTFQGKRVSAAGKQMLLDQLAAGESPAGTAAGVVAIAWAQRRLLRLVLIFISGVLLVAVVAVLRPSAGSVVLPVVLLIGGLGYLVMVVFYLIALYRLAEACGSRWAWLYVVAQFLSILGLISLLVLITKSNRMLRDAGLTVGLMGVKKSEIESMETGLSR